MRAEEKAKGKSKAKAKPTSGAMANAKSKAKQNTSEEPVQKKRRKGADAKETEDQQEEEEGEEEEDLEIDAETYLPKIDLQDEPDDKKRRKESGVDAGTELETGLAEMLQDLQAAAKNAQISLDSAKNATEPMASLGCEKSASEPLASPGSEKSAGEPTASPEKNAVELNPSAPSNLSLLSLHSAGTLAAGAALVAQQAKTFTLAELLKDEHAMALLQQHFQSSNHKDILKAGWGVDACSSLLGNSQTQLVRVCFLIFFA